MVKSLRGRWLAWQAALLAAVVGGFGLALYAETRKARFDEIDAELLAGGRVLEGSLRAFAEPPGRPPRPPGPPFPKPADPRRPPGPPPAERDRLLRTLSLGAGLVEPHADTDFPPYFAVWRPDGELLKASIPDPGEPPEPPDPLAGHYPRRNGPCREIILLGPQQARILVGRSVERDLDRLRRFRDRLILTGLGVFGTGLLGGWWVANRATRPLAAMSDTAARVTADRPGQRMDLAGVPTELAGLGSSINTMLDRLEDAFAQQVRFTADASHELRTPLAVLSSHLELALSRPRSPEEYRAALDTCRRAAKRMQSLTDGLLVLARADAGKLELQPERIDLAAIADEAVGLFAGLARQHNVSLAAHARPAEIDADPDRVHQIVANLIANAIQHNRPGGSVVVSTEATADHALLRVADTGAGIPADALPHVFGRFYRVDVARSRDHGGSGLGLAIVKELADAHGAEVAMASEPGRGTTVSITWPRPADA